MTVVKLSLTSREFDLLEAALTVVMPTGGGGEIHSLLGKLGKQIPIGYTRSSDEWNRLLQHHTRTVLEEFAEGALDGFEQGTLMEYIRRAYEPRKAQVYEVTIPEEFSLQD